MSSSSQLDNAAPTVHSVLTSRAADPADLDEDVADPIDDREVFDLVRSELLLIIPIALSNLEFSVTFLPGIKYTKLLPESMAHLGICVCRLAPEPCSINTTCI